MLSTAADAFDRARTEIGKLARRHHRPLAMPSEGDEDALTDFLEDGITRICTETDRMTTSIQIPTVASQEYVDHPPYVDEVQKASVYDSGVAWTLDVSSGAKVARKARNPDASTGRPDRMGAFQQRFYLYPVPDAEYTLDLQVGYNGATSANPTGVQDPPTLDTMVDRAPHELDEALTAYLMGRWFKSIGEPEVAAEPLQRFEREVQDHQEEPAKDSTSRIPHNTLG